MKRISACDVLILRQIRSKIVIICDYIYEKKRSMLDKTMELMDISLASFLPDHPICWKIWEECLECWRKGNYLRLRDLLIQEIDIYIMNQLLFVNEEERRELSKIARKENEKELETNYQNIFKLLCKQEKSSRINCSYSGSENVEISVKEGNCKFRLFSSANPWLESNELLNSWGKREFDIFYVLGFGGGYFIRELQRKYQGMKIKVYLPNLDIFKTVICNIPVSDVLQNSNLEIYYEPTCIIFLLKLYELFEKKINFGCFIDRQELRAYIGNAESAQNWVQTYGQEIGYCKKKDLEVLKQKSIGKHINDYIKSLII